MPMQNCPCMYKGIYLWSHIGLLPPLAAYLSYILVSRLAFCVGNGNGVSRVPALIRPFILEWQGLRVFFGFYPH